RPLDATPADLGRVHFGGETLDVMMSGDTHMDRADYRDAVRLITSGSPNLCRHRETRLGTVGLLEVEPGYMHGQVLLLGHTPGARNPGTAQHIEVHEGRMISASRDGVPVEVQPIA